MITSDYSYLAPEIAECLEESFERAGIAPQAIGQDHIASALRSIKFMLNSEWHTLGMRQWMIVRYTKTLTQGSVTFDLPTGTIDIFNAVLSRDARETPMYRCSRTEYLELADKTPQGRPDRYFVDRRSDKATVYLWQAPENSTDNMIIDYFRQMSAPGALANTLEMPPHTLEAFISGLTARLCEKYQPARFKEKMILYRGNDPTNNNNIQGALGAALSEDRERADVVMTIGLGRIGR